MLEESRFSYERAIRSLPARVFLARETLVRGEPVVTLHCSEGNRRALKRLVDQAFAELRITASAQVKLHHPERLARVRSMQSMVRQTGEGKLVYDPTGVIGRMEAVVACGAALRTTLGPQLSDLFFEPKRRTLYIVLGHSDARGKLLHQATFATMQAIAGVLEAWTDRACPDFKINYRVGYEPPRDVQVVSVDDRSVPRPIVARIRNAIGRSAAAAGVAAFFGVASAAGASAADKLSLPTGTGPAVAAPNFEFAGRFGSVDTPNFDNGFAGLEAKAAFPLGQPFGFQVEAGIGTNSYYGVGAHLFWRDPNFGLLGGIASYESLQGVSMARFGAEAELYLNRFTVSGRVGHQSGDVPNGLFGRLDLSFYATPNFVLRAGVEKTPDMTFGRAGLEWQPALTSTPGLSLFADTEFGRDRFTAMAGLKLHFGSKAVTLIDRHRKYDPGSLLFNLTALTGYQVK